MTLRRRLKAPLAALYRVLPFKRPLLSALRAIGLGRLLPDWLAWNLAFDGPFTVRVEDTAITMINGRGRGVEASLFWRGIDGYERDTMRWWRRLVTRAGVILDVGASTGVYALTARALNPAAQVHAFEPMERMHRLLAETVRLNPPRDPGCSPIVINRLAVSDFCGEALMYDLPIEHSYVASLDPGMDAGWRQPGTAVSEPVRVTRLDAYLQAAGCPGVDVIKLDIEGFEPAAIRGLGEWLMRCHPAFIVEICNDAAGQAVEDAVRGCDYLYFVLSGGSPRRRAHLGNDKAGQVYSNYLICTASVAREIGL